MLLVDAVHHGASVGFVLPLADDGVRAYGRKVWADVDAGQRLLIVAFDKAGRLVGSAQVALEPRANGRHRAEVQKVMVLASHRSRGIGAALMARVEAEACARGRLLLHLDASVGEGGATQFCDRLGDGYAGGIPDFAANRDGASRPTQSTTNGWRQRFLGHQRLRHLMSDKGLRRFDRPIKRWSQKT